MTVRTRSTLWLIPVALSVLSIAQPAAAGPLDPPVGPVAATGPTVITALPFNISTPGSYILTSNLQGSAVNFLTISASHVRLDLRGFNIGGSIQQNAIQITGFQTDVVISNGSLNGWSGGIIGASASFCRVENIWHTVQSANGIGTSIQLGGSSIVRGCRLAGQVTVGDYALIDDLTGFGGSPLVTTGKVSVVTRCRLSNGGDGSGLPLTVGDGSVVTDCAIQMQYGPPGPPRAISLGNDCTLRGCSVFGMGTLTSGVLAGSGCTIESCSFRVSQVAIAVTGGSTVRDCTIVQAGAAAIVATLSISGSGNRIEGNQIQTPGTGLGIAVNAGAFNNIILRNSVTGPTSLANAFGTTASNTFGPVIDARLIGQLNGTTANQAHPWANFWY